VGAGHRQHAPARQDALGQPLRTGNVSSGRIEHVLDRRVAARERVADQHAIAVGVDVRRGIALRSAMPSASSWSLIGG
jgi:hypothetical protein